MIDTFMEDSTPIYSKDEIEFLQCLLDRYSEEGGIIDLGRDHRRFMQIVFKHYGRKIPPVEYQTEVENSSNNTKELIEIDLALEEWGQIALLAHERNVTINKMIEICLIKFMETESSCEK